MRHPLLTTVSILASILGACGLPDEVSERRQAVLAEFSPADIPSFRVSKELLVRERQTHNAARPTDRDPIFGAGVAHWQFADPAGRGYSVADEDGDHLIWASPPTQDVDGIYQKAWGCGVIKVPDDCDYYNDGSSHHCNCWVNTCQWMSPAPNSFPACPK